MSEGYFTSEPGEYDEMFCDLCGTKMDVRRDAYGSRSWAGAMAGIKHLHDAFTCPYYNERWHEQADEIKFAAWGHPSKKISDIMLSEVKEIIQNKTPTKGENDD